MAPEEVDGMSRFLAWWSREGAETVVLCLAAGFVVEFFDRGEGFNPALFLLGVTGLFTVSVLLSPWTRRPVKPPWWEQHH